MNRPLSWFNLTSLTIGFAFLYLPLVLLILYSFNASSLVTVWGGWSLKWYGELFRDEDMLEAALLTLRLGLISATIATVLGTMAALALVRYGRFKGRTLFSAWSMRRSSCRRSSPACLSSFFSWRWGSTAVSGRC